MSDIGPGRAGCRYNLDRVAELRYEVLPPLEQELERLTAQGDAAAAAAATAGGGGDGGGVMLAERVGEEEVARVVARWTGIPVQQLRADDRARLLSLEDRVGQALVGQRRAVAAVCEAVLRSRAGLGRRGRPCLSMLFLGPTGVGKTELCRAVAAQLFDDSERVVRVDMSEYMEQHSVARLIGAPPGYVGHEAGGQLTEAVRRQPYSLVLLDEVDKAHPLVLDVLLQVTSPRPPPHPPPPPLLLPIDTHVPPSARNANRTHASGPGPPVGRLVYGPAPARARPQASTPQTPFSRLFARRPSAPADPRAR